MHGGKPVSVQRAQSVDGAATTKSGATVQDIRNAALLQRLHSVDGTEVKVSDPVVSMVTATQGIGKPLAQVLKSLELLFFASIPGRDHWPYK